ncbi:MAG: hypothetical protein ACI9RO_000072 [Alteromonas macleodii]|jgi:hypothetical protein
MIQDLHLGYYESCAVFCEVKNLLLDVTMCHCARCRRLCCHHLAAAYAKHVDLTFIR